MRMLKTPLAAVVGGVLVAGAAHAQLPSRDIAPAAVADSMAVLRALDDSLRVRANRDDADLWYRRGMLAWSLSRRAQVPPPVPGLSWQSLGYMADTSLRLAALTAPDRAEYAVAASRYMSSTFGIFNRVAARSLLERAQASAERSGDATTLALTAHAIGRIEWRLYQSYADRVPTPPGDASPAAVAAENRDLLHDRRAGTAAPPVRTDWQGELHFLGAERAFEQAMRLMPGSAEILRDAAGPLVERRRWSEMRSAAANVIRTAPDDPWGYLIGGLAAQRLDAFAEAGRLLTRGFAMLPADDRARMDRLQRILPISDTVAFNALPPARQREKTELYWLLADPLWSIIGDEPRTEFLARLVQAELRLNLPDLEVQGAQTDRGEMLVRWGPPKEIITKKGDPLRPEVSEAFLLSQWKWAASPLEAARYERANLEAWFFGLEDLPFDPDRHAATLEYITDVPVRWTNILQHRIDSLPTQSARFRGDDGVDLVYAARVPVAAIEAEAILRGATTAHWWIVQPGGDTVVRDSTVMRGGDGYVQYRATLPEGTFVMRGEGVHVGSIRAARAARAIATGPDETAGFMTSGFGMSDLLLADVPPRWRDAQRWSDLTLRPVPGEHDRRAPLHILWEVYEAGEARGRSELEVEVRLERIVQRGALAQAARIAMQIISGARGSARGEEGDVRVAFRRSESARPVLLDQFTLSLGESPAGTYRLTVEITDAVTGLRRARSSELVLR
jgi:GWxTD domain-containing protein